MRDYSSTVEILRSCAEDTCETCPIGGAEYTSKDCRKAHNDAADAIEELLAFAKFVARQAIDTGDNDGVSAEILCRKLNKLGLIETDGEFWMLPAPPKEELNKNVE